MRIGEVGIIVGGPSVGRFLLVEEESSGGFRIWTLERWPGEFPNNGWDSLAQDADDLREWFDDPDLEISWTGKPPGDG